MSFKNQLNLNWNTQQVYILTSSTFAKAVLRLDLFTGYRNCSLEEKWIENFVVPFDDFKKGRQKLSLLNLSKRDNIISTTFLKTLLQQSLKISLLFADFLTFRLLCTAPIWPNSQIDRMMVLYHFLQWFLSRLILWKL